MLSALPDAGHAAPVRRHFTVPSQPVPEALIAFAIQADISIGGVSACAGRTAPLVGAYTVREGLERLTSGLCAFEFVDPRTVRILARPRPPPATVATAPRPAPTPVLTAAPSFQVSELLVTATKRIEAAGKVPASISVLGADQLDATGAVDASGAIRQIVGVTMTNLGAGRDKIMLRGLSDGAFTGRTRSTVGTFLDNAPITYNAPDPDLRLADVDAVEVVRGPQGALYGAGSLSGVYRIVTRKPVLDRYESRLSALVAWTESGSPSQQFEAMVNTPIVEGKFGARLVAYHEVQGGYLDDLNLRLTNVDKTTRDGGRLALRALIGDNWTVTLSGAAQRLGSNDTQYVTGVKGQTRTNRVRENHANNFAESALTIEGVTDWGRLESSTVYVRHDFASQYDASAALSLFGDSTADFGVYQETAKVDMLSQDLVLTSASAGPFRWLVGGYASLTNEKTPSRLDARVSGGGADPRRVYTEFRTDRRTSAALYGKISYNFASNWTASAGARVYDLGLRTSSSVVVMSPNQSRDFVKKADYRDISPELSLQYEFADGDLIYGLISEGYRPGGFNSGGLSRPTGSRVGFDPDRLRNYEIGAKLRLFDRKLDLRTTAFYDLWDNIQTDQYLGSGLPYTANVGDGRNIGLELEASWRPSARWTFQANALVDQPKLVRVNPAFAARATDRLPGVPDLSFGALTAYERPIARDMSLLFTAETGYIGRSRLTFDPALSPEMGGYFTGKISAQLKTPRWRLAAFVENPTNSQGDTFAYGNPFSFGQVRQVTPQRPRTLSLALSAAF